MRVIHVPHSYNSRPVPFMPGSEVVGRTADGRRVMGLAWNAYASKAVIAQPVAIPEELPAGHAPALLV
jgi:NADPH2:quinone reductase